MQWVVMDLLIFQKECQKLDGEEAILEEYGNDIIEYIRTDIHDGNAEIIDFTSKLYSVGMAEYNAKSEENG